MVYTIYFLYIYEIKSINLFIPIDVFVNLFVLSLFTLTAAQMAKERVNKNPVILKDYNLEIFVSNGACKMVDVLSKFIKYLVYNNNPFDKMAGILGMFFCDVFCLFIENKKHKLMLRLLV